MVLIVQDPRYGLGGGGDTYLGLWSDIITSRLPTKEEVAYYGSIGLAITGAIWGLAHGIRAYASTLGDYYAKEDTGMVESD